MDGYATSLVCSARFSAPLITCAYTGSICLATPRNCGRDDTWVIIRRGAAAMGVTCFAVLLLASCSATREGDRATTIDVLALVGLDGGIEDALSAATGALMMVTLLFFGPCVQAVSLGRHPFTTLENTTKLQALRNIIIAPLTEELTFRVCLVSLLLLNDYSETRAILTAPMWFGIAHLHHVFELRRRFGLSWLHATTLNGFQILFTTVFGCFAALLFVRTRNLLAPLAAHMLCNAFGFPNLGRIARHPHKRVVILCYVAGVASFSGLYIHYMQNR